MWQINVKISKYILPMSVSIEDFRRVFADSLILNLFSQLVNGV